MSLAPELAGGASLEAPRPRWARLPGAAAFALPLVLYCHTIAPTVYGVDSAELTTGAYLLGIVHPPGSPTYLLLGHLFTWLPWGDIGYRVNLLSTTAAAASSFLLFTIVRRLTGDPAIGLLTSLVAATSYYLWITAVVAELYALQGAVTLALITLALQWRTSGERYRLVLLWLLAGLGLGVHLASALLLPGVALLVWMAPRPRTGAARPLLISGMAFLLGASVYAYLPLRHLGGLPLNPARDYWQVDLTSWGGFWWMISGGGFRDQFFAVPVAGVPAALAHVAHCLWSNFLGLGAILGAIGLAHGLRRAPQIHLGLVLMLAGHLAFFLRYGAGDTDVMNVPVLLLWAIWMGLGAAVTNQWIATHLRITSLSAGRVALASLVVLLALVNRPLVDVSDDHSARDRGETILATLAPDAVFVGAWPDLRMVEYLQHVEAQRLDVQLMDAFFSSPDARARYIAAALRTGRPVYVSTCRDLPDPALRCTYLRGCDCHRVSATP